MRGIATIAATLVIALFVAACSKEDPAPEPQGETVPVAATEPGFDPLTGFKMTGDWELVRANCTACHSSKLITQQRGTAQQWLTMIRWMQQKQNLWQFDPVTEEKIINYLAEHYPPSDAQRRAALAPDLMPPNPYEQPTEGP